MECSGRQAKVPECIETSPNAYPFWAEEGMKKESGVKNQEWGVESERGRDESESESEGESEGENERGGGKMSGRGLSGPKVVDQAKQR